MFWHDVKAILRPLASEIEQHHVLGLPLDRVLHFAVAAAILLVATRFMSRRKAILLTLVPIALKEVLDIPVKMLLFNRTPASFAADSLWDILCGLLGLGAALLVVTRLGDRWRVRPSIREERPLPEPRLVGLGPVTSYAAFALVLSISAAIFLVFEFGEAAPGRSNLHWLPHVVAIAAVTGSCIWFGTAETLLLVMPAAPFAIWLQRHTADDVLRIVNTLILTLLCCEIVRRLLRRDRRVRIASADWPLVVYAACAGTIVLVNCALLGWGLNRLYWLLPPVTGLAVCLLARNLIISGRLFRRAVMLLAASFFLVSAIGIAEFLVRPLRLEEIPGSVFGYAPDLSVYLSLMWPFFLAIALGGAIPPRPFFWLCTAAGAATIAAVFVRACWVASAFALVLLIIIYLVRRDWFLGLTAALGAVLCAVLLTWGVRQAAAGGPDGPFRTRLVQELASVVAPNSYQGARGGATQKANPIIAESPWIGETGTSGPTLHHALALNYGVPATILAAVAVLSLLANVWLNAFRSGSPLLFSVAAGATAAVAAAIIQGLAWPTLAGSSLQPFFWYVLGLASASSAAAREERP